MINRRELPQREAHLFKSLLRHYELRTYKKGVKSSDQILKKIPEHGETLCMRGLFLFHLGRKEEGYETVRKGLRNDLTSHICWHVYGLLYRADKNFDEAIKCYRNALKFDKNNIQILRDLSWLQIQMRNYDGYNETREILLNNNPNTTMMWTSYAFSFHLLKEYDLAVKVLDTYLAALEATEPLKPNFENSELLMYKNFVLEESKDYSKALEHLEHIQTSILDKKASREAKARLLLKSNDLEQAKICYENLIKENPDCKEYFYCYLSCFGIDVNDTEVSEEHLQQAMEICSELYQRNPRSNYFAVFPVLYAKGDKFKQSLESYLQNGLRKGIPSLFTSIKQIYNTPEKVRVTESVILTYEKNLTSFGKFYEESSEEAKELPTALLWTLYFSAQHFDRRGMHHRAMTYIDKAIAHTPTLVELHMSKARIWKHLGDLQQAQGVMNEARELDLQDRFVNSKCAKYALRCGNIDEAEKLMKLFTRANVDANKDLLEMQSIWYLYELSQAYLHNGNPGKALYWLFKIIKIFEDFYEEQFDFHSYALRKGTLRSYMRLLQFEDNINKHPYYVKTVLAIAECYMEISEGKYQGPNSKDNSDESKLSAAELKKLKSKQRKAELKAKQQATEKGGGVLQAGQNSNDNSTTSVIEEDTSGAKYLNVQDPLKEAFIVLGPMLRFPDPPVKGLHCAIEVALRRKKCFQALKHLTVSAGYGKDDPQLIFLTSQLCKLVATAELGEEHRELMQAELEKITSSNSAVAIEQHSLLHRLTNARVEVLKNAEKKESVLLTFKEDLNSGEYDDQLALKFIRKEFSATKTDIDLDLQAALQERFNEVSKKSE